MALYEIYLDDEQIDRLLDGETIWWELRDGIGCSIEVGDVDYLQANETAEEQGHKLGAVVPEEELIRLRDEVNRPIAWQAVDGFKVTSSDRPGPIEIMVFHEDDE